MPRGRPAGIKDVAARAGVSVGTVSNVLNRPDQVRPATRALVEDAMTALGFVRNESARQLRLGSSRIVAYVFLDSSNPFFTDVARGADDALRENGLALMMCTSDGDTRREEAYLSLLLEQRVHGVLLTSADYTSSALQRLSDHGVPVVLVDRPPQEAGGWCSVGVDDVLGGELAVTHLLEQQHQRVAFVGGPMTIPQVTDRWIGAQQAAAAAGAGLVLIETEALTFAGGREAAQRLTGMPARRRPTAAFCANDLVALGLLQQLTHQGVDVPGDIAIVGYDDIDFAAAAAVPLTSVRQPRQLLGRTAAELMHREAQRTSSGTAHVHEQVQFQPELVVRESSGVSQSRRTGSAARGRRGRPRSTPPGA